MNLSRGQVEAWIEAALPWLMDGDPGVRWQALRDLTQVSPEIVAQERAQVACSGFGATLLACQSELGTWGGVAWNHGWNSTFHALTLLRELGLDPKSPEALNALNRVRTQVTWRGCGPEECDANRFFDGEIEPCINGQVAAAGAYFGEAVDGILKRLLTEQLEDGGWNCEAPHASTRASFNTTICVLEALLEAERAGIRTESLQHAQQRGQAYLLERHLLRRRSTGERILGDRKGRTDWSCFAYPTWWHYDVLRGLDYLRATGVKPDPRVAEAVALVASKARPEGRWVLDTKFHGTDLVDLDEGVGQPNRWVTLRALRVLLWAVS